MSEEANKSLHHFPQSSRTVREGILESARTSQPVGQGALPGHSSIDISAPLARVEDAGRFVGTCLKRIYELEALFKNSEREYTEAAAQLKEAKQRITELEQVLAAEKERSARAEKLLAAVARRAQELELERSEAYQKLETLAAAVEGTFREFPSGTGSLQAAA